MSVRSWKGQKIKARSEISLCIDQITALISDQVRMTVIAKGRLNVENNMVFKILKFRKQKN